MDGYGCTVDWDGQALTISAKSKAAKVALLGEDWKAGDVTIPRGDMDRVEFKPGNPLVNGHLTVHSGGRKYVAHFRRKSNEEFEKLAGELGAER